MLLAHNITEIRPTERLFRVNWRIDIRCNYDCSYCDQDWHSNLSAIKTLKELQDTWIRIHDLAAPTALPIQLAILGGEPTANKNLIPFIEWLFANYGDKLKNVGISTNGSAPLKIYKKLIQYLDWISFSIHSEFFNEQDFFKKVIAIRKSIALHDIKRINVSIMDEHWNRLRFPVYQEILARNNIDFKIVPINWNHAIRNIPIINKKNQLIHTDNAS
jgi:organic radical activating enzyme